MEQTKATISLKKEKLINKIKSNCKPFWLFTLLFFFLGCLYSGFTYKNQYQSSSAVYYRAYAPSSYIEQMANIAKEKEVYANTANQLKQNKVQIHHSLEYDENDIEKLTTITMNSSLHLVTFTINYEEKESAQIICEAFLNNAWNHIKTNSIFSSTVLIMNHATEPIKYNNQVFQKMLLFTTIGVCVGICNCLIKSKFNPVIGTKNSLFDLGVETIISYDKSAVQKIVKEINLNNGETEKNYCVFVDSTQRSKNLTFVKEIAEQLQPNKKVAIVYLSKFKKKEKKSIQLEISCSPNVPDFTLKPEVLLLSTLDLLEEEKEKFMKNVSNEFDVAFWIIENDTINSFDGMKSEINIIFVRKGITDLNLFVQRYNQIITSNEQAIVIYQ